jgi:hypothetical protein
MFRRTAGILIADYPWWNVNVLCDKKYEPLLTDFQDEDSFHTSRAGYLQDLYTDASPADPFSSVVKYGPRLMISAPLTISGVTLRTPFLIDTGSEFTLLHTSAYDRFKKMLLKSGKLTKGIEEVWPVTSCLMGEHRLDSLKHNSATSTKVHTKQADGTTKEVVVPEWLGFLNVIGMDCLNQAVPHLDEYLSENFSKFQPPIGATWVRYGTAVFEVSPTKSTVDSLKDAVKAKWDASNPGNILNVFTLTVKDHTGNVLEVDAPLRANSKKTAYIVE